ncbi:circularly permuted type 2 ATP-grasp protein [Pseudoponticoccus marisrubri]|uniref:Uncharacterized protein n=1 Tax=Pseudoponticoccus marisrubri TaxID=1685382 RepID=A0A0W7WPH8_9RHOB|nr:circularly permuted type 2 ATP-grasp protein [Pseudoponticoccus marisrubri]KUF12470.1 hypothetical protein AVJ23_01690 [Pseudoponticoccus marisrubri]
MTAPDPDLRKLVEGYSPPNGVADELLQPDGRLRPVWRPLMRLIAQEEPEALAERFRRGDQYLHDAGVYYRQYSGSGSTERDWPLSHVPVMIGAEEWETLGAGIVQRAELLERVMADLYGPGRLVEDGHLPAEIVTRIPEWLRPMVGVPPRSGHYLHFLAFELGRAPDGQWFVLGDRTQAPSGAGFALENRMATGRVFPDVFARANVTRLAGFFRSFRDTLNGYRSQPGGRVGILTPGQHNATYYEHAYMARYLGFMLLEGDDLRVEDDRLTVRTIRGSEPVNVLWRRLDSSYADPLELNGASTLGTPGMVSALRAGAFTMVNALGSGVLEARALLAFLPRIAEELTGAPLRLPNIATWWCGQAAERAYVRDNLSRMMIGPAYSTRLPFDVDDATALGGRFRGTAHPSISDWLEAEGSQLVGQEAVTLSTTPAMIDGALVPRPMVMRVFAARTRDGWTVMPGGYARIGRTEDPTALALQDGGSVADVWIVGKDRVDPDTLAPSQTGAARYRKQGNLPSRAADNLFWMGRYVERADSAVRLLRAYHLRLQDSGLQETPLLAHVQGHLDGMGLSTERGVPEGLQELFDSAQNCAGKVRDRFSTDGWNALGDLSLSARALSRAESRGDAAARELSMLLRKLAGFAGLVHDNMYHSSGWRFLSIGRALERALQTTWLLDSFADPEAPRGSFDVAIEMGDSVMTHRRLYPVEANRDTLIDLMVLERENPRSVLYQLDRLRELEVMLPMKAEDVRMSDLARLILRTQTALSVAHPEEVTGAQLGGLRADLSAMSDELSARYLQ